MKKYMLELTSKELNNLINELKIDIREYEQILLDCQPCGEIGFEEGLSGCISLLKKLKKLKKEG